MSDNNSFLNNYGKNMGPAPEVAPRDTGAGYKYEEKSSFKRPDLGGGYASPGRDLRKLLIPVIAAAVFVLGLVLTLVLLLGGGVKVPNMSGWTLSDANVWASQKKVMLKTVQQYNDSVDEGKIIAQDIAADDTVNSGEFLTLTVSRGHDYSVTLPLPDLMSMTMQEVQAWADLNFMTKVRITTEFSDTVPSGKVIRFEINDNTVVSEVRRDTPVYVIISKGLQDQSSIQVTVPDFKTMTVSEAYIFANENGLILNVEEKYDDYVPKNSVISQSVKAQEKVSKGSAIKLVVSKGKMIEIPDFSDYTKEQASAVATGLGIPVTIIEKYSRSTEGRFLSQSLTAGSVYEEGDYLELTYSLGNEIALSSYVGQPEDTIYSWKDNLNNNKGANIKISRSYTYSNSPKGIIISQDPVNKMVGYSQTVTIYVSKGKSVYVPKFVDDSTASDRGYDTAITREEAMQMCEDLGLVPVLIAGDPDTDGALMAGRLPGEVYSQVTPLNTEVSEGTAIKLSYKPYDTTVTYEVPDFTILTIDAITSHLNEYYKKFNIMFEGEGVSIEAQSVAEKTLVFKGTTIILTLG